MQSVYYSCPCNDKLKDVFFNQPGKLSESKKSLIAFHVIPVLKSVDNAIKNLQFKKIKMVLFSNFCMKLKLKLEFFNRQKTFSCLPVETHYCNQFKIYFSLSRSLLDSHSLFLFLLLSSFFLTFSVLLFLFFSLRSCLSIFPLITFSGKREN